MSELKDKLKQYGMPALAATAAGAALFRGKKTPGKLVKVLQQSAPKSRFKHFLNKMEHGADRVFYDPHGTSTRKLTGMTPKDKVMLTSDFSGQKMRIPKKRAPKVIGKVNPEMKRTFEDKQKEMQFIGKHAPGFALKHTPSVASGKKGLIKHHLSHEGNYLIKPTRGAASGVGGASFVNKSDVDKYLSKSRMPAKKRKLVNKIMKNPSKFVFQSDIGIKKDPITGANREMRVHAIGGKVVPGATGIRSKNISDVAQSAKAEKFFQGFLNKLPKKIKQKGIAWNPDIAVTDKGFKIIELNAGPAASGLIDPTFMRAEHGNVKGFIPAAVATKKNMAIYEHLMKRKHPLERGIRAAGGAAAAGIGTHMLMPKKNETKL